MEANTPAKFEPQDRYTGEVHRGRLRMDSGALFVAANGGAYTSLNVTFVSGHTCVRCELTTGQARALADELRAACEALTTAEAA